MLVRGGRGGSNEDTPGEKGKPESGEKTKTRTTYLTRFCVHSRSRLVSRATLTPSEKFERAPFRRRWARACSSMSSRCLAFNWPELLRAVVLVGSKKSREISPFFTSIKIMGTGYILTFALARPIPCPMAWGQKCPACGHSEHRQRRLPNTIRCWIHSLRWCFRSCS